MFEKKTRRVFLGNKALGFILICQFEQDEASAGPFDVKAPGMIRSHSSAIPEPLWAPDCGDICSPRKGGAGLGFETSELDGENKQKKKNHWVLSRWWGPEERIRNKMRPCCELWPPSSDEAFGAIIKETVLALGGIWCKTTLITSVLVTFMAMWQNTLGDRFRKEEFVSVKISAHGDHDRKSGTELAIPNIWGSGGGRGTETISEPESALLSHLVPLAPSLWVVPS